MTQRICSSCGGAAHDGACALARTVSFDGGAALETQPLPFIDDAERYQVDGEAARGGLGRVLRARDRRLQRSVALKELLQRTPEGEESFIAEAIVTAQLQHPGVVPIYDAGRWSGGAPFYAMKLISGRSLSELIKSAADLPSRLALLPNVVAVAETVAYAHNQQIVHRDLKPANVMVGEFGETLVVDWGLAQRRNAPSGRVAGTPQYMAPEQARGLAVDERADVYALGALLYHLLAGESPYFGKSSDEVLVALEAGPPQPLRQRVSDTPPELAAIVERAMARDPAARYPNARELATELKRFQTGQLVSAHRYSPGQLLRRWLERHRLPVTVGAVGLVLLVVMAVVSVRRIVAERDRAERQRAAAEELSRFMLSDLKDQLAPVGRLDALEGVGQKLEAYYRELEKVSTADVASQRRRAQALSVMGQVAYARGRVSEAADAFRRSDAIEAALPSTLEVAIDRAENAARWGGAARDLGRLDEGDRVVRQALDRLPSDGSAAAAGLALLAAREVLEEARGDMKRALDTLYEELPISRRAPGQEEAQLRILARIGALEKVHDKMDSAAAHAEECVRLAESLAAQHPGEPRWLAALNRCRWTRANVVAGRGDFAAALDVIEQVLVSRESLAERDPGNVVWQEQLADALDYRSDLRISLGRSEAARADAERSRDILEKLLVRDPDNVRWVQTELNALMTLADLAGERRDFAAQLALDRRQLELAQRLTARDPGNLDRQSHEAVAHARLGETLRAMGKLDEALRERQVALAIGEKVAAAQPGDSDYRYRVADSHLGIADVELAQRRFDAALSEYRAALDPLAKLAAAAPDDWLNRAELGRALFGIGEARLGLGEDAHDDFQRTVDAMAPIEKQLDPAYTEVLVKARKRLAHRPSR